jgi:hypothetical protein
VIVGEGSNGTNGTSDSPTRGDVSASSARMLHTTSRDIAEWLEFSRGLVIEPVLPWPLLVASQATVPHRFLKSHTFSRQGWAGTGILPSAITCFCESTGDSYAFASSFMLGLGIVEVGLAESPFDAENRQISIAARGAALSDVGSYPDPKMSAASRDSALPFQQCLVK